MTTLTFFVSIFLPRFTQYDTWQSLLSTIPFRSGGYQSNSFTCVTIFSPPHLLYRPRWHRFSCSCNVSSLAKKRSKKRLVATKTSVIFCYSAAICALHILYGQTGADICFSMNETVFPVRKSGWVRAQNVCSDLKLPLFLKWTGVTHLSRV